MKAQSIWIKPVVIVAIIVAIALLPIDTGCTISGDGNNSGTLEWNTSIDQALITAKNEGKLVLLDFWGGG